MSLFEPGPRPSINDDIRKELAAEISKEIMQWSKPEGDLDIDTCTEAAEKILRYHINDNGYELAKEFEDALSIYPDTQLVEILDDASSRADTLLKKRIKAWVQTDHIKPLFSVGDSVIARVSGKEEEGEIMDIRVDVAEYLVWTESSKCVKGKGGYVLAFEKVKPI